MKTVIIKMNTPCSAFNELSAYFTKTDTNTVFLNSNTTEHVIKHTYSRIVPSRGQTSQIFRELVRQIEKHT